MIENNDYNFMSSKNLTKRRRLKRWVKNLLWVILGAIISITINQLFIVEIVHETPVGNYTCRGGIIKICTGSNEVADYLGV